MTDYDKLKLAHELSEKIDCFCEFNIFTSHHADMFKINYDRIGGLFHRHDSFPNIDSLLTKLKQLTQPKAKYAPDDVVWLIDCDCICTAIIEKYLEDGEYRISKCFPIDNSMATGKDYCLEEDMHPTKQSLIEAQIAYWMLQLPTSAHLSDKVVTECQHVCDQSCITSANTCKCSKCGKFYR